MEWDILFQTSIDLIVNCSFINYSHFSAHKNCSWIFQYTSISTYSKDVVTTLQLACHLVRFALERNRLLFPLSVEHVPCKNSIQMLPLFLENSFQLKRKNSDRWSQVSNWYKHGDASRESHRYAATFPSHSIQTGEYWLWIKYTSCLKLCCTSILT